MTFDHNHSDHHSYVCNFVERKRGRAGSSIITTLLNTYDVISAQYILHLTSGISLDNIFILYLVVCYTALITTTQAMDETLGFGSISSLACYFFHIFRTSEIQNRRHEEKQCLNSFLVFCNCIAKFSYNITLWCCSSLHVIIIINNLLISAYIRYFLRVRTIAIKKTH